MPSKRRNVLRVVGGVFAGSLAGCLGSESESTPTSEGTPSDEPGETPDGTDGLQRSGIPEWTSWTPSPAALGLDGGYELASLEPSEIESYSESLPSAVTDGPTTGVQIDGLGDYTDQRRGILISDGIAALFGPHETDTVQGYLTDRGLERQRTVNSVEIYAFGSQDWQDAFGVASDVFVRAGTRGSNLGVDAVEAVAAMARDDERLPTAVPDIGTALALVAPGESVSVRSNTPEIASVDGASVEGYSWRLGTDRTTVSAAFVGDAVGTDAVQSWASESERFGAPSVAATDGSAVTATASVPTGEVGSLEPNWETKSAQPAPQVEWQATYDADAGLLTIEHRSGDTIDASNLYVRGSGFADVSGADQTSPGPWQGETSDNDGIAAGNTVAVGVTSSYDIRLVYEFPDSDRVATLFGNRSPDA